MTERRTASAAHNVVSFGDDTAPVPPAQARSTGLPARMGKATESLKTRVPDEVKLDFMRLANSMGMDESTLLRTVVMVRLYGLDTVQRMQTDRIGLAAGSGPLESTQEAK